ncbi:hypothetical protein SGGMMB4_01564 [Sodalis glossinidius str. 'morsitans']|uniref:Uncharacterized protein n=1 Tax=Sodalis glossinidius (strain morsitans) TaxID=343509 RepID=A0A193QGZ3_SODGM|nr:hypothetical protein SGGMMB4_01564 [Sodalis glossinidius str. 'morsitans']
MSTTTELALQDLTFNHCINRVKRALEAVPGVRRGDAGSRPRHR